MYLNLNFTSILNSHFVPTHLSALLLLLLPMNHSILKLVLVCIKADVLGLIIDELISKGLFLHVLIL